MDLTLNLFEILRWDSDCLDDFLEITERNYQTYMLKCVAEILTSTKSTHSSELVSGIKRLQAPALKRILISPELNKRVNLAARGDSSEFARFIQSSLTAEHLLMDESDMSCDAEPSVLWTALGDYQFSVSAVKKTKVMSQPKYLNDWGLLVDWKSPNTVNPIDDDIGKTGFDQIMPLNTCANAIHESEEKLSLSAYLIADVCPQAQSFIKRVLSVVCLRFSEGVERGYLSYSSRDRIGRAVLVNCDLPQATIPVLVNALIHEAIHSLIYRLEIHTPLSEIPKSASEIRYVSSPWSGKQLRLSTYLHACYIYWALYSFWDQASLFGKIDDRIIQEQRQHLIGGFIKNKATLKSAVTTGMIKPAIAKQIGNMTSVIKHESS
ncbi:MAG: hypothetical protein ABW176_12185 [Candidatus Thiodiazotropha endolucinida]